MQVTTVEQSGLERARKARGMTRAELSRRAKVPVATIKVWERALPESAARLLRVCDALGADVREVVGVVSDH